MTLWLVGWGYRSETATVAIVEADSPEEARMRASTLDPDSFMAPYAAGSVERATVEPVHDGLVVFVDAPH